VAATKAEQAAATRGELVKAAKELFAARGYAGTSIEDVLARVGVSKGALYHHFPSKEALFQAVFEENEQELLEQVMVVTRGLADPLEVMRKGCQVWLDLTMDPAVRRISFIDGPAVLGWQLWRDLDAKYGFGVVKRALQRAMDAGRIENQSVELLAHILVAGLGEAAMVIARSDDPKRARREAGDTMLRLLDGLTT
jgi:AcrR family transcriptional regulator